MQEASLPLLSLVIGNQHIRPQSSLHLLGKLFVRAPTFIHYPNKLQKNFLACHSKIFWETCRRHIT